jgi:hypothetical protein
MTISRSTSGIFLSAPQSFASVKPLKKKLAGFVKRFTRIMRGVIIKSISPEEFQAVRRLQAIEGYLELGMFEEAAAELSALDPAWFASQRVLSLQLRVLAASTTFERNVLR